MLLGGRPRQRIVAPLAADAARTVDQGAAVYQPATAAGTEDYAEDGWGARSGTIHGLREGKAVGVVGESHRAPQVGLEVALQRLAVEPRRVGVLHEPARRRHRAGYADADAACS